MKRIVTFSALLILTSTSFADIFTALGLVSSPNPEVYQLAKSAYNCAISTGAAKPKTLTIIDYSMPSTKKRLWVIDMANHAILFNTYVAHGVGSGGTKPTRFSNRQSSHATSLGLYRTGEPYQGQYGYSLRLIGLDPGYNDNAYARAVVIHGMASSNGSIGYSWGCPAVPKKMAKSIINTIKGGDLIFAYYPSSAWMKESKYLNCRSNIIASNSGAELIKSKSA